MRWALLLLLAAAFLSGCKNDVQAAGGKQHPPMVGTIISLSPSTTELCAQFGLNFRLIGRTAACNFPPQVKTVEVVAQVKPDYEKIVGLQPGVIIFDDSLYSASDVQQIHQKLNSDHTVFIDVKGDTIDSFDDSIYELGKTLHSESQCSEYVDKILAARATAQADPLPPSLKVAVLLPGSPGLGYVAGLSSFQNDVVKAAGGTMIGPEGNKFASVSPEAFVQMNPDIIVLATTKEKGAADVAELLKNPQLQSINAIKNKKIVTLDADVVERRGSRVDGLIETLHRQLKRVAG